MLRMAGVVTFGYSILHFGGNFFIIAPVLSYNGVLIVMKHIIIYSLYYVAVKKINLHRFPSMLSILLYRSMVGVHS